MATEEAAGVEAQPKPGSRAELYRYQSWVHVGPGAENCEDVDEEHGTVDCHNPLHFHAWVRLPSTFQHADMREKAMAAKARRMRLLREDGSDVHAILEEELDALLRRGEIARARITEELIGIDWWRYLLDATRELDAERVEEGDDDSDFKWAHIEDDRLRSMEIREMPEEDQPADELKELEARVAAYDQAVVDRRAELAQPDRNELESLDMEALIDRLRDARIDSEGSKQFQNTLSEQEWFVCTYRFVEGPEHFAVMKELHNQPNDVLLAIAGAFSDLEREKGGVAQGNS